MRSEWKLKHLCVVLATAFSSTAALAQPSNVATQLNRVVVTASGFEQEIKNAPASISVITREDLEERPVHSIAEALRDVEGVDVTDGTDKSGSLQIQMRGMPADYTLILVDGRRQNSVGNVQPNGFERTENNFLPPISAIERIEVIRGPMSTLYGADAMGGVVNIITRKISDEWRGAVNLGTTINFDSDFGNNTSGDFYIDGPLKKGLLGMSVRGAYINNQQNNVTYTNEEGDEVTPTFSGNKVPSHRYDTGLRFALTPTKDHDIVVEGTWSRQRYDNSWCAPNTKPIGRCGPMGRWNGGYSQDALRFNRDAYTLAHTGRYSFGTWDSSIMHNTTETIGRLIPEVLPAQHRPAGTAPNDPRDLKIRNIVFDTKLVTPLGTDSHMFTLGGQWWSAKMTDTLVGSPMEHKQWGIFGEDEWSLRDDLTLTLGARYDHHNWYGGHFSPRAYVVWNTTPNWTVKGGISRGFKAPKVNELAPGIQNVGGQGTRPIIGGNPDMKPETSTSSEIGFIYDNLNNFSVGATFFNTDFKDKLESERVWNCRYTGADRPAGEECVDIGSWTDDNGIEQATFSRRTNLSKAVTRGLEFQTKYLITDDLDITANYTYTYSRIKYPAHADDGKPLTSTPKNMFNTKLTWYPNDALTLWTRLEYRGKRYRDNGGENGSDRYYRSLTLAHVGGTYRVNKNVALNMAVYNLFDTNTVDYQKEGNRYANQYRMVEPGRRLWLSTNITF